MTRRFLAHRRPGDDRVHPRGIGARRDGQAGVALTELVLVLPLLITLVFGIWEISLGWGANLDIQSSIRGGARIATALGDDRLADYQALSAMDSGLEGIDPDDVEQIVIFQAEPADGEVPDQCRNGTSVNGLCNVYDGSDLSLEESDFTGTDACDGSSPDHFWCPLDRDTTYATSDYLGVWIQVLHPWSSPAVPGDGITIEKTMVMRIEPERVSDD